MKNFYLTLLILALSMLLISTGCENDYPSTGPDYPLTSGPTPIISDISPDSSYSGIGIITITGQYFSADISENRVFFDGEPGKVLLATETELEVQVPPLVEDSILIQLNVTGAFLYGEYGGRDSTFADSIPPRTIPDVPFKLNDAIIKYLAVTEIITIGGLAVDPNENIYTILSSPQGIIQISEPDSTILPQYSSSPTSIGKGMRWGPAGYLYLVRKNKNIYRVLPGGGSYETFAKVSENLLDLDFDENGNLFAAGKDGLIFSITPSADTATVAHYDEDYDITVLRVYDGYLYSVLDYGGSDTTLVQRGIWRNQIVDANGTLGSNEFMFDWDAYAGKFGPDITDMVIDENGIFYLGNDYENNDDNEAITKLDIISGIAAPLYPEILEIGVNNLCWGNTNYLYIHRFYAEGLGDTYTETRELLRLAMPVNSAPYYGRQ